MSNQVKYATITEDMLSYNTLIQGIEASGMILVGFTGGVSFTTFLEQFPEALRSAFADETTSVVLVSEALKNHLTEAEFATMIKHEEGHVVLGHLNGQTGVVNNMAVEIEADDYALQSHSAADLLSGFNKVIDHAIVRLTQHIITTAADADAESVHELVTNMTTKIQADAEAMRVSRFHRLFNHA